MKNFLYKNKKLILFLIGLVTCIFSNGRFNIAIFGWIWPACMLASFRLFEKKKEVILGTVALALAHLLRYWGYAGVGIAGDMAFSLIIAFSVVIPLLLDRLFYRRLKEQNVALAIFFTPFVFTAVITLFDLITAFPQLAYSQGENLPLIQSASVIGAYGLSFLMMAFASALAYAITEGEFKPVKIASIVLVIVMILGGVRLVLPQTCGDHTVHMATALTPIEGDFLTDELYIPNFEEAMAFTREKAEIAKAGGADVLVLGEEAIECSYDTEEKYVAAAAEIAKENSINIFFPIEVEDPENIGSVKGKNMEYLLDSSGNVVTSYIKTKLLPSIIEADYFIAGDGNILYAELPTSDGGMVNVSSVICFDSNNERYVTGLDDRTDVLIVPAWCWAGCEEFEANELAFRAVENNVALVTACVEGKSSTYDWTGRVLCRTEEKVNGRDAITFTNVPVRNESNRAIYHYIANWFDWIYVLGTVAIAIYAFKKQWKHN